MPAIRAIPGPSAVSTGGSPPTLRRGGPSDAEEGALRPRLYERSSSLGDARSPSSAAPLACEWVSKPHEGAQRGRLAAYLEQSTRNPLRQAVHGGYASTSTRSWPDFAAADGRVVGIYSRSLTSLAGRRALSARRGAEAGGAHPRQGTDLLGVCCPPHLSHADLRHRPGLRAADMR